MVKYNRNLTIYVRITIVLTLLITIPCFVLLGYYYLNTLSERDQAVRTSVDAQSLASQQETNLQVMNALLKASLNNIFAGQSATVHDPSLVASGGLIFSDLTAREADFDHTLGTYQSNYEVATSKNMSTIRTILLNDNPATGPIIVSDQQQALSESTQQWHLYRQFQDTIINQLAPLENDLLQGKTLSLLEINRAYERIYPIYYQANIHFTDLRISWRRVVDAAASTGKTVTSVGPLQTTPVLVAIIIPCTILLIFALVWGSISFRTKRLFSLYSEGKNSGNTPIPPSGSIPPVPQLP